MNLSNAVLLEFVQLETQSFLYEMLANPSRFQEEGTEH